MKKGKIGLIEKYEFISGRPTVCFLPKHTLEIGAEQRSMIQKRDKILNPTLDFSNSSGENASNDLNHKNYEAEEEITEPYKIIAEFSENDESMGKNTRDSLSRVLLFPVFQAN